MLTAQDTTVFPPDTLAAMDDIAARIRKVLDLRGWSAAELNRRAGLASPTHITTILRRGGARAGGDTLRKVAHGAGISERWLLTGEGSPDHDDDARAPSTTDDATPIMANVPGWEDAVKVDRAEHEDITDVEVSNGERIAAYMLHRPAVRGDLWEIVQQMRRVNDPTWLAQKIRESDARVQKLIEGLPEQYRWEQEQLAKKRERR